MDSLPNEEANTDPCINKFPNMLTDDASDLFNPHSNIIIIDVEGYSLKNDFFVKELACYNPSNEKYWTALFLPPFNKDMFKKKYEDTITNNKHGLKWDEGHLPYSMLYQVLEHFGANFRLYARGKDKIKYLQNCMQHPLNDLESFGCPPASELPQSYPCIYHDTTNNSCALNNAIKMGNHFFAFYKMNDLVTAALTTNKLYVGLF